MFRGRCDFAHMSRPGRTRRRFLTEFPCGGAPAPPGGSLVATHDRLDGVTRPRSPIGPALTGAVDLSGLKQRAQQSASAGGAPGPSTPAGPGTTEVTEANFEAE